MASKPKLGQNFLHDASAIRRIADALGDVSSKTVIEIGPGTGAITRELVNRAAHLDAIELDAELSSALRQQFPADRFTVHQQDVLTFDFAAASAAAGHRLPVVGNLPYYMTSPILLKLAESHASLDRAVLMVQREVADRITAEPGSRDYGLLTVTVQMYGPVERLFTLPPGAFSPPPEVYSAVFRWRFSPRFAELNLDEKPFLSFVRKCFAQKRKTISNNLRAAGFPGQAIQAALLGASIPPQTRAEALSLEQFACLWRAVKTAGAGSPSETTP